jgi:hypothetical protein
LVYGIKAAAASTSKTCIMNLHIPTPCHENWEAMQPNPQGAFCGSCSKNVVDFSTMSDDAIKAYFLSRPAEKVCGRFTNKQLKPNLEVKLQELPVPSGYSTIFLYALFLVFGTSLFSCTTPMGRTVGEVVVVHEHPATGGDTLKPVKQQCVPEKIKMGKVSVNTTIDSVNPPVEHMQGGVMVLPEPEPEEYLMGDLKIEPDTLQR